MLTKKNRPKRHIALNNYKRSVAHSVSGSRIMGSRFNSTLRLDFLLILYIFFLFSSCIITIIIFYTLAAGVMIAIRSLAEVC